MVNRPSRPSAPRQQIVDPVVGLAGSIAHDFSNLLMIVQSASTFLKEHLAENDWRQEYVAHLLAAADRGTRLTQQLQAIGRSQLLSPEVVRPGELLRKIADTLRRMVPEDVDFELIVRAPNAAVMFDPSQLPVVIMNLVSYAAERVSSHGRLHVIVATEELDAERAAKHEVPAGQYVAIMVAKTGQGMTDDQQRDVFKPRSPSKRVPRGTDLRLASAQSLVLQSGGFVDISSELGAGSTFTVHLPVVRDEPVAIDAAPETRLHAAPTGDEVILVVEDDAPVRSLVREALERYGYSVLIASDGADALRVLHRLNTSPDLVLTDLIMPEMTGWELISELRLLGNVPKILMISGYDDNVLQRATVRSEFPFMRKPFTHEELAAKVRAVLDA